MTDRGLYKAITNAQLNQLNRDEAIVAMMWAELFADGVMWVMNKFTGVSVPLARLPSAKYATQAPGF